MTNRSHRKKTRSFRDQQFLIALARSERRSDRNKRICVSSPEAESCHEYFDCDTVNTTEVSSLENFCNPPDLLVEPIDTGLVNGNHILQNAPADDDLRFDLFNNLTAFKSCDGGFDDAYGEEQMLTDDESVLLDEEADDQPINVEVPTTNARGNAEYKNGATDELKDSFFPFDNFTQCCILAWRDSFGIGNCLNIIIFKFSQ